MESEAVRALIEVYYDVQKTRISAEHRIRKAGEHGLSEASVERLMDWLDERMDRQEAELKGMVLKQIKDEPLWKEWLEGVRGVGPCIAGGLMAWAGDCSQFDTVSNLWANAGLHVVSVAWIEKTVLRKQQRAEEKKAAGEKLSSHETPSAIAKWAKAMTEQIGQAPRRKAGIQSNWNPTLRTLCWKAGQSFVRVGEGYRELYLGEKVRLRALHPEPIPFDPPRKKKDGTALLQYSDGHVDAMARRKVVKVFLSHYWQKAREQAGLPTRELYVIEKLGHTTPIPVVMR